MNKYFLLSILFCCLQLQGQEKKGTIQFVLTFNDKAIELDKNYYLPSIEDSIQFEAFKFYVSDIQFLKKKKKAIPSMEKKYLLIDLENPKSLKHSFTFDSKKRANFKTLQFSIGIDSLTNVSGVFGGDLDPTNGMYWTWQSGYINFKLEGTSPVCPARHNRFQFHIGGYAAPFNALQKVDLKISDSSNIEVRIAIDKLLSQINLAEEYQIMSPNQKAVEMAKLIATIFSAK
ncbi:MAG: MbnP family protein [Chitinophagales bacterium]